MRTGESGENCKASSDCYLSVFKITNDGRKLALDQRLIDPMLPDDPDSKVNACVDNIYRIWEKHTDTKASQLVFSDLSTPTNKKIIEMQDVSENVFEMLPEQFENVYVLGGELRETQTANYFSNFSPVDCAVPSANA